MVRVWMQNTSPSRRKSWDAENSFVTVETDPDFGATQTRQLKTSDANTNDAWLSELGEYLGDSAQSSLGAVGVLVFHGTKIW